MLETGCLAPACFILAAISWAPKTDRSLVQILMQKKFGHIARGVEFLYVHVAMHIIYIYIHILKYMYIYVTADINIAIYNLTF